MEAGSFRRVEQRGDGGGVRRARGAGRRAGRPVLAILLLGGFSVVLANDASAQELMGTRIVGSDAARTDEGPEGTIRTYFDAPTSTLLNLGLRSTTLDPGETPHPVRPHSRPTESMLLIEAGSLEVRLDDRTETLGAGAVVLLGPNQWHQIRNAGSVPVTFYEVAWTSPGMTGEPDYPEAAVNWRRPRQ